MAAECPAAQERPHVSSREYYLNFQYDIEMDKGYHMANIYRSDAVGSRAGICRSLFSSTHYNSLFVPPDDATHLVGSSTH